MADPTTQNPILAQAKQTTGQTAPASPPAFSPTLDPNYNGVGSSITVADRNSVSMQPILPDDILRNLATGILELSVNSQAALAANEAKSQELQREAANSMHKANTANNTILLQAQVADLETQNSKRKIAKSAGVEEALLANMDKLTASQKYFQDVQSKYLAAMDVTAEEDGVLAWLGSRKDAKAYKQQMKAAEQAVVDTSENIQRLNAATTDVDKTLTTLEETHTDATVAAYNTKLKALTDAAYQKSQVEALKTNSDTIAAGFKMSRDGIATAISVQAAATNAMNASTAKGSQSIKKETAAKQAEYANIVRRTQNLPEVTAVDIIALKDNKGVEAETLTAQINAGFSISDEQYRAAAEEAAGYAKQGVHYVLSRPMGASPAEALDNMIDGRNDIIRKSPAVANYSRQVKAKTMALVQARAGAGADLSKVPQQEVTAAQNETIQQIQKEAKSFITPDSIYAADPYPALAKYDSVVATKLHKNIYVHSPGQGATDPDLMFNLAVDAVMKGDIKPTVAAEEFATIFKVAKYNNNNTRAYGSLMLDTQETYPYILEEDPRGMPVDLSDEAQVLRVFTSVIASKRSTALGKLRYKDPYSTPSGPSSTTDIDPRLLTPEEKAAREAAAPDPVEALGKVNDEQLGAMIRRQLTATGGKQ